MTLWHRYGEAFRRRALRLLHWRGAELVVIFESDDRLCFDQGRPAVVDTHRVNFTGRYRDGGLRALGELLDVLSHSCVG